MKLLTVLLAIVLVSARKMSRHDRFEKGTERALATYGQKMVIKKDDVW